MNRKQFLGLVAATAATVWFPGCSSQEAAPTKIPRPAVEMSDNLEKVVLAISGMH